MTVDADTQTHMLSATARLRTSKGPGLSTAPHRFRPIPKDLRAAPTQLLICCAYRTALLSAFCREHGAVLRLSVDVSDHIRTSPFKRVQAPSNGRPAHVPRVTHVTHKTCAQHGTPPRGNAVSTNPRHRSGRGASDALGRGGGGLHRVHGRRGLPCENRPPPVELFGIMRSTPPGGVP